MFLAIVRLLSASSLIWAATTENPFPASPARAASIDAFSDKRLVCEAIWRMFSVSDWICAASLLFSIDCSKVFLISLIMATAFVFSFSISVL